MRATTRSSGQRNQRNNKGSSELSEFAPVLYIMFLVILLPLLDLVAVFVAGATQYLATNDFAAKAATQADYSSALNSMVTEAYQFQTNGLAKFAQMVPEGGFTGCGDDLYVLVTDTGTGAVTSSAADLPLSQPINTQSSIYELSVKSIYNVGPLVSLAAVPILGDIPGLGKPVTLTFSANRPVEHPGGLQAAPSGNVVASAVTPFARVNANSSSVVGPSNSTWRTPNIFEQIKNAGETVSSVNVVLVQSNNTNWTQSGIVIAAGQKIWIDTQSVGVWNTPGLQSRDANGIPNDPGCPGVPCFSANFAALVGVIGITGPITANAPGAFFLGDDQFNYPPVGTGMFSMGFNDWGNFTNNTGAQLVRVIVAN
jgi:Flp pilus assembly protein TadG